KRKGRTNRCPLCSDQRPFCADQSPCSARRPLFWAYELVSRARHQGSLRETACIQATSRRVPRGSIEALGRARARSKPAVRRHPLGPSPVRREVPVHSPVSRWERRPYPVAHSPFLIRGVLTPWPPLPSGEGERSTEARWVEGHPPRLFFVSYSCAEAPVRARR